MHVVFSICCVNEYILTLIWSFWCVLCNNYDSKFHCRQPHVTFAVNTVLEMDLIIQTNLIGGIYNPFVSISKKRFPSEFSIDFLCNKCPCFTHLCIRQRSDKSIAKIHFLLCFMALVLWYSVFYSYWCLDACVSIKLPLITVIL